MAKNRFKTILILLFSACWLSFISPENSSALPPNIVKKTDFRRQDAGETIVILTKKAPSTTHVVLHDPERIVLDIHEAFIPQIKESKTLQGKIVSAIRMNQNQKDVVRVVLDINDDIPYFFNIETGNMGNDTPGIKIFVSHTKSERLQPEPTVAKGSSINSGTPLAIFDDTLPEDIFEDTETGGDPSNFSISGRLDARASVQTREQDKVENNAVFRNRILLEGKYKTILTISTLSDYLRFGSENKNETYDIKLHEAKWEHVKKKYSFSLGKQIIRWGKTDQISPVDTLNPEDFREFILPNYEDRKIPVWMADARLYSNSFTLEGIFIPFFKPSKLDYFNTNWSVFGHMKKELSARLPSPALKTYIKNLTVHETEPEDETEFALRLSTTIKRVDLGFTFHHMIEDTPYFKSFPIKNINASNGTDLPDTAKFTNEDIEVEYKRTKAAGFEFETTWVDIGLRGEALWKEKTSFLTSSLTSSRHPTFTYILGADYTTTENTYINIQFMHSHIYDFSPDILYFDIDSISLLGEMRVDLISDWLQGGIEYNVALNNNSLYFSPYLKYTYITNLECIAGISLFFGDRDTWFGRYRNYDLVYVDMRYRF